MCSVLAYTKHSHTVLPSKLLRLDALLCVRGDLNVIDLFKPPYGDAEDLACGSGHNCRYFQTFRCKSPNDLIHVRMNLLLAALWHSFAFLALDHSHRQQLRRGYILGINATYHWLFCFDFAIALSFPAVTNKLRRKEC